jgi:hypothetical protein
MAKNYAANLKIGAVMASSVGRVFGNLKNRIRDQEGTLKKLREQYKLAAKGTGEYAGRLDELQREITQTEGKLKRLKAAAAIDLGKSLRGVGSAFTGDMKRLGAVAGIATGAVVGISAAIGKVTVDFLKMADDLLDTAEALNISTEGLQTWEYAAADVGVEARRLHGGFTRLQSGLESGSKKTIEALEELGINTERLQKLEFDDQLNVIAEAFAGYSGGVSKAHLATSLFGRSNANLVAVLNKGKKGLEAYNEEAREAGFLLDEAAKEKALAADKAYRKLGASIQGIRNQIALEFLPAFSRLSDSMGEFLRGAAPGIRAWAERFAAQVEEKVIPAVGAFMAQLPGMIDQFSQFATKVWGVVTAVKDFVGGWENLGYLLLAANFAPTIAAIASLAKSVGTLAVAMWAAVGPVGLIVGALALVGLAIISIVDPGGPLDILGKLFPETMESIRNAVAKWADWMGDKIDFVVGKITGLINKLREWMGMDPMQEQTDMTGENRRQYELPRNDYEGLMGVPAQQKPARDGLRISPESLPTPGGSADEVRDFLRTLKPGTQNFDINIDARGADGEEIGRRLRQELENKPLGDYDGALVPR